MTFIKYSVLALMVAVVIIAAGCATKDPLSPQTASVIMPLNVGNTWVYNVNLYSPTSPTPTDNLTWTIEVVARENIDSRTWYRTLHIITDAPYTDTMIVYYANFADGLHFSAMPSDTNYLELLYPASVGATFTGSNVFYGTSLPYQVMATNASAAVPLGTYQCYYYKATYSTYRIMHEYYKPNTGMVKMEWEYYNSTYGWYTDVLFELTAMTLH